MNIVVSLTLFNHFLDNSRVSTGVNCNRANTAPIYILTFDVLTSGILTFDVQTFTHCGVNKSSLSC